jgi:hypothetical protein
MKRHLDRSNGQSHRPLRSGETPHFAFAVALVFAVALACSYKPPKPQQKPMSSPKKCNSMKTKQIN